MATIRDGLHLVKHAEPGKLCLTCRVKADYQVDGFNYCTGCGNAYLSRFLGVAFLEAPDAVQTGYAVNLAGSSRANVARLDDEGMAKARAKSEARRNRQATEVIDRASGKVVYRVGFGKK